MVSQTSNFDQLVNALQANVTAVKSLRTSFLQQASMLGGFFNPLQTLGQAFNRSEKLQLQSLAAGTSYNRFLTSNTKALEGLQSSNLSLSEVLMSGFTQGLRNSSRETMKLIDEMVITGQNTEGLMRGLGSLRFLTGNSINATSNLSKTILDTNRESGITASQLIDAMNSFQAALFDASIYGETAVQGLAELGVVLQGGLAGAPGAQQAINTLLGMQDSLNIAQQEQLGVRVLFDEIRQNGFSQDRHLGMIVQANNRLESLMGDDPMVRSSISRAFGSNQVRSLSLIAQGIQNFEGLSEEQKKDQLENFESMRSFEESKMKFFNDYAPGIYTNITKFLPIIAGLQAGGQFIAAGRALEARNLAGLGKATKLLGFLGPIGVGLSFMPEVVGYLKGILGNTQPPAELAQQQLRARRTQDATTFGTLAQIAANAIQQSGQSGDPARLNVTLTRLTDILSNIEKRLGDPAPSKQTQQ
jgi:hypothetical protein